MSTYRSGTEDMRAFAELRIREAEQTLTVHHPDGVGCCASCGRDDPCDTTRFATQLGHHYRAWLSDARSWVDGDNPAARIRPYVLERSGGDAT
ncbi:hypothetical protein [Krasilnikovia sp. MM14-A1259]|uniref:hypothetical protein n=1 Tax=Krasilnikovia sp. MM14-A1259 TaxID=3373539 RepID=UPI00382AED47